MKISKKGQSIKIGLLPLLLIAAVGVWIVMGSPGLGDDEGGSLAVSQDGQVSGGGDILASDSVTITFSSLDDFDNGAVTGTHDYRVRGSSGWSAWQTVSNGGSASNIGPGVEYEVVWNAGNTTYYNSKPIMYTAPNRADTVTYRDSVENGTLTVRMFNEEGDLITGNTNETIGVADTVTLTGDVRGSFEKGLPHGYYVIVEFNGDNYDQAGMSLSINGQTQKATTPSAYSLGNAANKAITFQGPALRSNEAHSLTLQIDADDTNNPGITDDITLTIVPLDYFKNGDTDSYELGAENEDGSFTGQNLGQTAFTVNVD